MNIVLTDRESDLMDVLWDHGACTVAEVRERLDDDLAYTTVLTILRTLEAKGYVAREEVGKAHRYSASVARQEARHSALRSLSEKLFDGSAEVMLMHLVENEKLSSAQLKRIRLLLDQRGGKTKP